MPPEVEKLTTVRDTAMVADAYKEKSMPFPLEETLAGSSHFADQGDSPLHVRDNDVHSYKAIGGVSGHLLEQNSQALKQISVNLSEFKIHENLKLFAQTRNNILALLNDQKDMPEAMKKMPPIPVKLDEELANFVLSGGPTQKKKT